jgi:RNA:NAD 2'-phosphotransferase (TPT1/KptA family)
MDLKDAALKAVEVATQSKGKWRLKELASIIAALGWITSCNISVDLQTEQGRVKDISVLVGSLATMKAECDTK